MNIKIMGNEAITCIEVHANGYDARITKDHVLIWNSQLLDDPALDVKDLYDEIDVGVNTEDLSFYDLTDRNPYYWQFHDKCIVAAIDSVLMDVEYIRISYWETSEFFFSDMLDVFIHSTDNMSDFLVRQKDNKYYDIKGVTTDRETGEITGFVAYSFK